MSNNKKDIAIVKRDSTKNWLKAQNYIPPLGTIIIMENEDGSIDKIRFGNGSTNLHNLPDLIQERYTSSNKTKYHQNEELLEL